MRRRPSDYRSDDRERRHVPRRRKRDGSIWRYVVLSVVVAGLLLGFAVSIRSQLESLMSPLSGADDPSSAATPDGVSVSSSQSSGRGVEATVAAPDSVFGQPSEHDGSGSGGEVGGGTSGQETRQGESQSLEEGCVVSGRVTDYWGRVVPSVHVRLQTSEGVELHTLTDKTGIYRFEAVGAGDVSLTVLLENSVDPDSGFSVRHGAGVISITSLDVKECEVNVDAWSDLGEFASGTAGMEVDQWGSALSIFQNTRRATELAPSIGLDTADLYPFEVQAWCPPEVEACAGKSDGAFFVQTADGGSSMIAIVGDQSDLMARGVPDNREYHEFGHLAQAVMTGSTLPQGSGDSNHGGYFGNPTSTDSMVEGFGEFLSMMVSKHVDRDPYFEMYRIGAEYDLEMDRLPWELEGWWEEFTVAGILLDFEDGGGDYSMRSQPMMGLSLIGMEEDAQEVGTLVSGRVENSGSAVLRDARVTVEYLDETGALLHSQVTRVLPELIAPGREGEFYAVAPNGLEYETVVARSGGVARSDDDPVDVELADLLGVMFSYGREDGGLGVATVHDLYVAMSEAAGDSGAGFGAVTQEQVDEIFINHGFYEDLDGSKTYDVLVDGEIGRSSHFSAGPGSEFVERWDPNDFDRSRVTIDTGGLADEAVIQVSLRDDGGSSGYAFTASLGEKGEVILSVPPSGEDAEMSVVALGDGLKPSIAFRLSADEFHQRLDAGTLEGVTVSAVQMVDAEAFETRPMRDESSFGNAGLIMLGSAALLALIAGGAFLVLRRNQV